MLGISISRPIACLEGQKMLVNFLQFGAELAEGGRKFSQLIHKGREAVAQHQGPALQLC